MAETPEKQEVGEKIVDFLEDFKKDMDAVFDAHLGNILEVDEQKVKNLISTHAMLSEKLGFLEGLISWYLNDNDEVRTKLHDTRKEFVNKGISDGKRTLKAVEKFLKKNNSKKK